MRKQHGHGYELYNTFNRNPLETDWYIIPVVILFALIGTIALVGADNFIEVMSEFIVGTRAN